MKVSKKQGPRNSRPQIPLVLVQIDEGDYNGESCLDYVPRVVPIYAEKYRFTFNGVEYEREMLPLKLSLADTVHSAQGSSSVKEHVMVPPIGRYDDFTRGLIYVALSRVTKLSGLYLIGHNLTTQMVTKWAPKSRPSTLSMLDFVLFLTGAQSSPLP